MAAGLNETKPGARQRGAGFAPRDATDVLSRLPRRRRFVRFMKFVLPAIAVATIMVVFAWPQLNRRTTLLPIWADSLESVNAALVMNNPRYRGSDASGQPYTVTADRAIQDPEDDKQVTLDRVQADFAMNNGQWWSLTADTGVYNGTSEILDLFGNINIFGNSGYEMHAHAAEVDLKTKIISSDEKVWGQTSTGTIHANGMRVYDSGKVIVFINGVKTRIFAQDKRG